MSQGFESSDAASHVVHSTARAPRRKVAEGDKAEPTLVRRRRKGRSEGEEPSHVESIRLKTGMSQRGFWKMFGVSQSAGCRYESENRSIPGPVLMLVAGFDKGLITRSMLADLRVVARAALVDAKDGVEA